MLVLVKGDDVRSVANWPRLLLVVQKKEMIILTAPVPAYVFLVGYLSSFLSFEVNTFGFLILWISL